MTQADFFEGLSYPRNKEIIRIFKDLGMVEQLGSGVPRILRAYPKECFHFGNSFLRITIPISIVDDNSGELVDDETGGQVGGAIGSTIGGTISGQTGGQTGGQTSRIEDEITQRQKVKNRTLKLRNN